MRRALAEKWVRETEVAMEEVRLAGQHHDLGDLTRRYLNEIGAMRQWGRTHQGHLQRLARDLAGTTLAGLTAEWLVGFARGRGVSPASTAKYVNYLGSVLRTAEALWGVPVPWPEYRKGRALLREFRLVAKGRERERRPQPGEVEAIVAAASSRLPVGEIVAFAAITGLRISEVVRLRWEHVDARRRCVFVEDRKHPTEKEGNSQWVPLLGRAWGLLAARPREGDFVWPYKAESVTAAFRRARKRAGVEGLRWHDLRHEAISRMFEAGYAIPEVAMVSGHRDWNQLRRYTNLRPETLHLGPAAKRGPAEG